MDEALNAVKDFYLQYGKMSKLKIEKMIKRLLVRSKSYYLTQEICIEKLHSSIYIDKIWTLVV